MKKLLLVAFVFMTVRAQADMPSYELTIKGHKFSKDTLEVKANEKFKLTVKNEDPSSEEFESATMIIEKFMGPNKTITVILGPLKPGSYDFIGEYHQATAKGKVIAKD